MRNVASVVSETATGSKPTRPGSWRAAGILSGNAGRLRHLRQRHELLLPEHLRRGVLGASRVREGRWLSTLPLGLVLVRAQLAAPTVHTSSILRVNSLKWSSPWFKENAVVPLRHVGPVSTPSLEGSRGSPARRPARAPLPPRIPAPAGLRSPPPSGARRPAPRCARQSHSARAAPCRARRAPRALR